MRTLDLRKNRPGRQPHAPQSAVDAYPCACCGQPVPEIAAYGQDPHCSRRCAEAARDMVPVTPAMPEEREYS